jgi:aldose sugar dehydrogenase
MKILKLLKVKIPPSKGCQFMDKSAPLSCIIIIIILVVLGTGMTSQAVKFPTIIHHDGIVIQKIADSFNGSSGFEFVGKKGKDILITEKEGKVKLIRNFILKKYPILDLNVSTRGSGLMGITSTAVGNKTYVFLFYSGNPLKFEEDADQFSLSHYIGSSGNRVYRYEWNASGLELDSPIRILDLPSAPRPINDGGKVIMGPDGQLYTVIGDLNREGREQNMPKKNSSESFLYDNKSESSAILRTTIDGLPSKNNPFSENGFERFYAYGIRNSFGIGFDPVTKYLWDTEQGPGELDEVNLVKPGFNSGWKQIQGRSNDVCCPNEGFKLSQNVSDLYYIKGSHYEEPKFVWHNSPPVTALTFMNSSALGKEFVNDLFVGDIQGNIYRFNLDKSRENIVIKHNLSDYIFSSGFGSISDLKIGPDGALYVLTFANNTGFPIGKDSGGLYRIAMNALTLPLYESQTNAASYQGLIIIFAIMFAILIFLKFYKKNAKIKNLMEKRL